MKMLKRQFWAATPTSPSPTGSESASASRISTNSSRCSLSASGERTAAGEIYDMHAATAAHGWLPFGTWVQVENLRNGQTVDVRINDRGPFVSGRIVDLSYAAARVLGMLRDGVVPVRLRVLRLPAG